MASPVLCRESNLLTFGGRTFGLEELKAAFELVENRDHWKGPINALVLGDADIYAICAAVEFYTATEARIAYLQDGSVRVTAPGYWAGPAC